MDVGGEFGLLDIPLDFAETFLGEDKLYNKLKINKIN
jgi:hypothetical protein